ncbi:MAG TPA: PD-(D/E)XK nuclease family protein [Thermoanaerobaculia bacterium]|nr:PD-(D/E)XK nuclease family protein [Thermoanaerobaculia bacterium]
MPQQLSLFDVLPAPPRPPGRVLIAQGARAAERTLLERLDSLLEETRQDPALLARPVRIVVPSRSLRLHLSAAIVRRRGRSASGVILQSLFGLASEVLEKAGEPAPRGGRLFAALAQRAARAEPILRRGLEDLVDGYSAVTGSLRDLLDAGLEPVHAEAAEEALASDGLQVASRAEVERARALVRAAARAEEWMRGLDLGRVATLLRRATEVLEGDPERALAARAILIHGFADATGVATDLLHTLLAKHSAWLILDHPPRPEGGGPERAFPARFQERLSLAARVEPVKGDPPVPPRLEAVEAVGCEAEVREVARRIRVLLDGGARPEAVGVVARDLAPYRFALRRHFGRLGIPFSGVGESGGLMPAGRRAQALLELLRQGEAVPSDRWLSAMAALPGGSRSLVDLRLAFFALGAGRLRDVTELRLDEVLREGSFPLPIRQGLKAAPAGGDEEPEEEGRETEGAEAHAYRRRVAGPLLLSAQRSARKVRDRLSSWPEEAAVADHLARLRSLLTRDLGWRLDSDDARPVTDALEEVARESPPDLALSRQELRLLLADLLDGAGAAPLGGAGGGVQVLSVVEARARTFDHLFLIGLNRDIFPRTVREDPLLPDDLRRVLQRVLPDVPVKRAGFDEERYLFAQLLSAGISATLSWQAADDDGKPLAPSPLVERLRDRAEVAKAPSLWALPAAGPLPGPRTAAEHVVMAGLHAPRRWWGRVLPLALAEARAGMTPAGFDLPPDALAASRLAVLDELDPDLRTPEGRAARSRPGPYFGYLGPAAPTAGEGEVRRRRLFVTLLENLAACPWQVFLERLLHLEPTPDPVGALPGIDPLLLGNTVHAVLEGIVRAAGGLPADVDGPAGDRLPVAVDWPRDAVLDRLLLAEAERLLREEGIFLPGLAQALADRARPFLMAAREADWAAGAVSAVGVEEQGTVEVADGRGRSYRVRFQADRVDRTGGVRVWTDYKTGKPISTARRADVRRRHFLDRVRKGSHLQAVAYLLGSPRESLGRYLYLRPDLDGEQRELVVTRGDEDFVKAFRETVAAVLDAWATGAFFPRVVEPSGREEPGRCGFCAVAEACLRGDSGARLRLFEWTVREESPHPGPSSPRPSSPAPSQPPSPGEEGDQQERSNRVPLSRGGGWEGAGEGTGVRALGRGRAAEEALLRVWRLWEKPGREEP